MRGWFCWIVYYYRISLSHGVAMKDRRRWSRCMFVSRYPSYRAVYITCTSGAGNDIIREYLFPRLDVIWIIHFLHLQLGLLLAQTLRLHSSFPFMRATHLLASKHRQARVVYIGGLFSVLEQLLLNSRYTHLPTKSKHSCKMTSQSPTWLDAPANSPGTSFENPLVDFHAQRDLTATRYYILDPTRGVIQTTNAGALEYAAKTFAILHSSGTRMRVMNGDSLCCMKIKKAKTVLLRLNDPKWEFIDMRTAMAEAASDQSISYGKIVKRHMPCRC